MPVLYQSTAMNVCCALLTPLQERWHWLIIPQVDWAPTAIVNEIIMPVLLCKVASEHLHRHGRTPSPMFTRCNSESYSSATMEILEFKCEQIIRKNTCTRARPAQDYCSRLMPVLAAGQSRILFHLVLLSMAPKKSFSYSLKQQVKCLMLCIYINEM